MYFSQTQSQILAGLSLASLITTSIAGSIILKKHDEVIKQYNNMRDVGIGLGKIATYQNTLLGKHSVALDEFDRVVFDDLTRELKEKLIEIGYLKESTQDEGEES